MDEVRWERLFPDQLERRFAACPVLYLPYGLCEPHGPQNALGLDALKAHAIACRAAEKGGGIVAPVDYWHIHEVGDYAIWAEQWIGEVQRNWMTSLPPWQHFKNVCYHLRTADRLGFKAAILLTGHYGVNYKDLWTLLRLAQPRIGTRLLGLADFEVNLRGFTGEAAKPDGDHAGRVETSQLWALEPDCVDVSRFPPGGEPGPHFAMGPDARESDRRVGERMVAEQVALLVERAGALVAEYDRLKPAHGLRTFDDVERLWDEAVKPALPSFLSMQLDGRNTGRSVSPDSVWYADWKIRRTGGD